MMEEYQEMQLISKDLQLQLAKKEIDWADEKVQLFLPVILFHTEFDWLKLIAENTLVEEDEKVVKNFLSMAESLKDINSKNLEDAVWNRLNRMFDDFNDR